MGSRLTVRVLEGRFKPINCLINIRGVGEPLSSNLGHPTWTTIERTPTSLSVALRAYQGLNIGEGYLYISKYGRGNNKTYVALDRAGS